MPAMKANDQILNALKILIVNHVKVTYFLVENEFLICVIFFIRRKNHMKLFLFSNSLLLEFLTVFSMSWFPVI